jgi:hypothetical protein
MAPDPLHRTTIKLPLSDWREVLRLAKVLHINGTLFIRQAVAKEIRTQQREEQRAAARLSA